MGIMQVFDMFDIKRDGVISFGEFVRSLSIFHPNASEEKKIECRKSFVYYIILFYFFGYVN